MPLSLTRWTLHSRILASCFIFPLPSFYTLSHSSRVFSAHFSARLCSFARDMCECWSRILNRSSDFSELKQISQHVSELVSSVFQGCQWSRSRAHRLAKIGPTRCATREFFATSRKFRCAIKKSRVLVSSCIQCLWVNLKLLLTRGKKVFLVFASLSCCCGIQSCC